MKGRRERSIVVEQSGEKYLFIFLPFIFVLLSRFEEYLGTESCMVEFFIWLH